MSAAPLPSPADGQVAGRLTVVVPTRNSDRTLAACLHSARGQTYRDVEIVVVDNYSTDATPAVAAEIADRVLVAGPERSAQRNRGAQAATGEFVAFIDSDMRLTPDVAADAVARLAADPALDALVLPEHAFGDGFWAGCRVLEKQLYLGDAAVEAARVFRRRTFLALGGFDEDLTGAEDWDLPDRLAAGGGNVGRTAAPVLHDEGRLRLAETYRKKRYYGRWIRAYLRKHPGVGSRRLLRLRVLTRARMLAAHPLHAAGLLMLKSVEAAGLARGMLARR